MTKEEQQAQHSGGGEPIALRCCDDPIAGAGKPEVVTTALRPSAVLVTDGGVEVAVDVIALVDHPCDIKQTTIRAYEVLPDSSLKAVKNAAGKPVRKIEGGDTDCGRNTPKGPASPEEVRVRFLLRPPFTSGRYRFGIVTTSCCGVDSDEVITINSVTVS